MLGHSPAKWHNFGANRAIQKRKHGRHRRVATAVGSSGHYFASATKLDKFKMKEKAFLGSRYLSTSSSTRRVCELGEGIATGRLEFYFQ